MGGVGWGGGAGVSVHSHTVTLFIASGRAGGGREVGRGVLDEESGFVTP